jgi:dTDP-4-amino-4,6-dideoxygalactose transaminase
MKSIPYGKQYLDKEDLQYLNKAAKQDLITSGKSVKIFENKVSKFLKSKYVLACNSGTAAIHLALIAVNLRKGDIVIMPSINFIAAYSMCKLIGAKVFLADVDCESGQLNYETLLNCIKKNKLKKVKVVINMYMGGYPNHVQEFIKLKKKYKFYLIEDACHAFGSSYKVKNRKFKIGSCKHCDISTFSLHPVKTFTTGEGGLVSTNNNKFYKELLKYRSHGIEKSPSTYWKYNINKLGFNYRLSDINCALGISQLKKVKRFIKDRERVFKIYKNLINKYAKYFKLVNFKKSISPSYHLLLINIDFTKLNILKDDLIKYLNKKNIFPQYHYIPLYNFSSFDEKKQIKLRGAEIYYKNTLSLPIFFNLDYRSIKKIVQSVSDFLINNSKNKPMIEKLL